MANEMMELQIRIEELERKWDGSVRGDMDSQGDYGASGYSFGAGLMVIGDWGIQILAALDSPTSASFPQVSQRSI